MKKYIYLIIFSLFYSVGCILLPPSAKVNNPTDSPIMSIVTALSELRQTVAPSFVLSDVPIGIPEGSSSVMGVRFLSTLDRERIVTISSNSSLIVPEPSTLTFSVDQGTVSQAIRLNSLVDSNTSDESVIVSISSEGVETVNLTIARTDSSGNWINWTPTLPKTLIENTSTTVSVYLTSKPGEPVEVNFTSDSTSALTVTPSNLTFTPVNYNIPQSISLNAVNDSNQGGKKVTLTISSIGMTSTSQEIFIFDDDTSYGTLGSLKTGRSDDGGGSIDRHFTDLGNNLILDDSTRLFWQKCMKGDSGTNCETNIGSPNLSWTDANNYCNALSENGLSWRLPTNNELASLVNANATFAFYNTYFPNPNVPGGFFWSGTKFKSNSAFAWNLDVVGQQDGIANSETNFQYVRCVSGDAEPSKRFVDNGDETISDQVTGLVWTKCTFGLSGNNCSTNTATQVNQSTAKDTTCPNLTTGGVAAGKWRLPTRNELQSIHDYTLSAPAINQTYFPNTQHTGGVHYWSSTYDPNPNLPNQYMVVTPQNGEVKSTPKTQTGYVRCVYKPDLINITPTIPTTLIENTSSNLAIKLNSQPTEDVTINLVSSNTNVLSVSHSSLTFTSANYSTPQTISLTGVNDSTQGGKKATLTISATGMTTISEDVYILDDDQSFVDNGNGTITDQVTGLVWYKCTFGTSGNNCTDPEVNIDPNTIGMSVDWTQANSFCPLLNALGLAGDWRLPTSDELLAIHDYSLVAPTIQPTYFPNTFSNSGIHYWTSTMDNANPGQFLALTPQNAEIKSVLFSESGYFRCVRNP